MNDRQLLEVRWEQKIRGFDEVSFPRIFWTCEGQVMRYKAKCARCVSTYNIRLVQVRNTWSRHRSNSCRSYWRCKVSGRSFRRQDYSFDKDSGESDTSFRYFAFSEAVPDTAYYLVPFHKLSGRVPKQLHCCRRQSLQLH